MPFKNTFIFPFQSLQWKVLTVTLNAEKSWLHHGPLLSVYVQLMKRMINLSEPLCLYVCTPVGCNGFLASFCCMKSSVYLSKENHIMFQNFYICIIFSNGCYMIKLFDSHQVFTISIVLHRNRYRETQTFWPFLLLIFFVLYYFVHISTYYILL